MLRIDHLYTGYGHKIIGKDLCATLQRGQLTALLGPNGAGKSTLLRTLAGFIKPINHSSSTLHSIPVSLNGKDLSTYQPRELACTLSIVLTSRTEAEGLTAIEVVEMGRIPHTRMLGTHTETDRQTVEQAMQLTNTQAFAKRTISTLSDGERQRVFIAKALAQATPVILLDEPTAFLDFPSKAAMMQLLHQLAHQENKAILLSTHDVELALQYADTLWLLNNEQIKEGTPNQLARSGDIGLFFNSPYMQFDAQSMRFTYHAHQF